MKRTKRVHETLVAGELGWDTESTGGCVEPFKVKAFRGLVETPWFPSYATLNAHLDGRTPDEYLSATVGRRAAAR